MSRKSGSKSSRGRSLSDSSPGSPDDAAFVDPVQAARDERQKKEEVNELLARRIQELESEKDARILQEQFLREHGEDLKRKERAWKESNVPTTSKRAKRSRSISSHSDSSTDSSSPREKRRRSKKNKGKADKVAALFKDDDKKAKLSGSNERQYNFLQNVQNGLLILLDAKEKTTRKIARELIKRTEERSSEVIIQDRFGDGVLEAVNAQRAAGLSEEKCRLVSNAMSMLGAQSPQQRSPLYQLQRPRAAPFQRQGSFRQSQNGPRGVAPRRQAQPQDICHNCQRPGHWASACPMPRRQQGGGQGGNGNNSA